MLEMDAALARAEEFLDTDVRPWLEDEIAIDVAATVRAEACWVFFYNTRAYLETGSMVHALAGNGPIIVWQRDGRATLGSSAIPWEDQV
jgi:Immunity protein 35